MQRVGNGHLRLSQTRQTADEQGQIGLPGGKCAEMFQERLPGRMISVELVHLPDGLQIDRLEDAVLMPECPSRTERLPGRRLFPDLQTERAAGQAEEGGTPGDEGGNGREKP